MQQAIINDLKRKEASFRGAGREVWATLYQVVGEGSVYLWGTNLERVRESKHPDGGRFLRHSNSSKSGKWSGLEMHIGSSRCSKRVFKEWGYRGGGLWPRTVWDLGAADKAGREWPRAGEGTGREWSRSRRFRGGRSHCLCQTLPGPRTKEDCKLTIGCVTRGLWWYRTVVITGAGDGGSGSGAWEESG